ncbi:NfeD-like domain containing protein [Halorhabdus tiamatea SARL4B]|uniref:Activity regulator-like protein of membrane protease YbbK n=1 Tax=Halorhabdus tiamatea SARL4B TaxID=1033806 RepID=F7PPB8_9EURY|nr:NfeD family protein [Halorhabdus tiamatea]ERJ07089.1 NfeD-like domain containing protein [Halorhabdus tiamatea SARL4B]CCQ32708.1 activity regulator-like protein of membrane protease YbbK [Halorhabdus tiamatea SARL4B]
MVSVLGADLSLLLLLVGALLVIGEAFVPGAHFIVLGIALLVAGLVGLALPQSLGIFAVVIMAGLVLGVGSVALYAYRQFDFYGGKGAGQTSDSDSLKGKTGRVTERVTGTDGEVKLDGGGFNPYYQARAFDREIPEGEEIIVVDPGGGNVITVESMATLSADDIDAELQRGVEDEQSQVEENGSSTRETADETLSDPGEPDRETESA